MMTFEEAKEIAIDYIGPDCGLIEKSIVEKPYGWHFFFQSKKYLKTRNFSDMLVGSGGFIVEKDGGNVVEFGSAYDLERNFKIYEMGLAGRNNLNLVITKVRDLNLAVRLLYNLGMTYVEPEWAHGVEWKIPQRYSEKQIKDAISKLPHIFRNQRFYFRSEVIEEIDNSQCLIYELRKHR